MKYVHYHNCLFSYSGIIGIIGIIILARPFVGWLECENVNEKKMELENALLNVLIFYAMGFIMKSPCVVIFGKKNMKKSFAK